VRVASSLWACDMYAVLKAVLRSIGINLTVQGLYT